jgi:hypothetical protein
MAVSFAGVPLLLEDQGGEVARFLEQWLPAQDASWFCPTIAQANPLAEWLPQPNYPPLPSPRINTLVMPTGATRWSCYLALVDESRLAQIRSALSANLNSAAGKNAMADLVLQTVFVDSEGNERVDTSSALPHVHELRMPMHALPARKISFVSGNQALWLLPLVDDRYWWQQVTIEAQTFTKNTIYYLIQKIESLFKTWFGSSKLPLGDLLYDGKPAASLLSGVEDTDWIQVILPPEQPVNAAQLLDSMLMSRGYRLIPRSNLATSPPFKFKDYDCQPIAPGLKGGNNLLFFNPLKWVQNSYSKLAEKANGGGTFFHEVPPPNTISVFFPKWINGLIHQGAAAPNQAPVLYKKTYVSSTGADYPKHIYSTAVACVGGATDNTALIDSLADAIAKAYFDAASYHYDLTFPAIAAWQPTPLDNCLIMSMDRIPGEGGYRWFTRVQSLPPNHGPEKILQFAKGVPRFGERIYGTLQGALAPLGTATLRVEKADGPRNVIGMPTFDTTNYSETYRDITVTEAHGWSVAAGKKAMAEQVGHEWIVVATAC